VAIKTAADIPRGSEIETDVCIIGAGPAGISLALHLTRTSRLNVVLLESGGMTEEDDATDLNRGENVGLDYFDLTETRHRLLGGSSHHWAGWSRPLDRLDFEGRPWVPNSGWPISYDEFLPYYEQAAQLCQLESTEWTPGPGSDLPPLYQDPFIGDDVEIALWQGSPPTKFGDVYREDLETSPQVTVILDATAIEIDTDEDGTVASGVQVASLSGNAFAVRARATILAAGAFESPRLLLASRRARPDGLGNENDLVGRYFMEHPHLVTARIKLFPASRTGRRELAALDRGFTGARARLALQRPSGARKAAYVISSTRQEAEQLLNFSTHLQTVSPVRREDSEAYKAFKLTINNLRSPRRFFNQVRSGSLPDGTKGVVGRLIRGTPEIATLVYREALQRPRELALYTQSEQAPNPDSRMTLDHTETDRLGVPRIKLDWRLSRVDKESVVRSQQIIGERLEKAGVGQLEPMPAFLEDSPDWGVALRGGHHHLGTARASTDPGKGVVDAAGQVHTVRDLYVADSSVFPAGGYANPLLTIVAWSIRLADTVARRYG
jgi:choline dehydrogenase-like flavoprotein